MTVEIKQHYPCLIMQVFNTNKLFPQQITFPKGSSHHGFIPHIASLMGEPGTSM